jgi:hypothetical protein
MSVRLKGPDGNLLVDVVAIERQENALVLKGKIMGAMPMTAKVTPEAARALLKLLNWKTMFFLLSLPFRKG